MGLRPGSPWPACQRDIKLLERVGGPNVNGRLKLGALAAYPGATAIASTVPELLSWTRLPDVEAVVGIEPLVVK